MDTPIYDQLVAEHHTRATAAEDAAPAQPTTAEPQPAPARGWFTPAQGAAA